MNLKISLNQVLVGKLPLQIFEEIDYFVEECRIYKNNKLGFLRNHLNAGKNAYQISVPIPLIEDLLFSIHH